ncbi:MAG: metal ABC transporter permease [Verrucomicrobia bacterium]|nr:metal ABC transporter permease [Verrucomicrobiota bacterium]
MTFLENLPSFMLHAFTVAVVMGPLCALLGVFVTARRMAFFSDTISHSALAGIGLGFLVGLEDPTWPIVLFSLLIAGAILWLKEHTDLLTDTIMALLLSGSVAFGIIVLSLLKNRRGELHRYLFGDILSVNLDDVWLAIVLSSAIGMWLFTKLSPVALLTASEDLAHVSGVRTRWLNYAFVLVLTVVVSLSIRLLGIILVTSLVVIPPAAARNLARNLRQQLILSLIIGLIGGAVGTVASYHWDIPCGPAIVMVCLAIFILSLVVGKFWLNQPTRAKSA